jgi:hypothetical protein
MIDYLSDYCAHYRPLLLDCVTSRETSSGYKRRVNMRITRLGDRCGDVLPQVVKIVLPLFDRLLTENSHFKFTSVSSIK